METNKDILKHIKVKPQEKIEDAYFEQFRARMIEEIKTASHTKIFYLKPLFWLSTVAASLLIFFSVQFFKPAPTNSFSNLSEEEILSYMEENDDDIEIENIPEVQETKVTQAKEKIVTPSNVVSDKNVELASLDNFVSSEDILNEISAEDIYLYMNSEEFDLEDLDLSQFNF